MAICVRWFIAVLGCCFSLAAWAQSDGPQIGKEVAIPRHQQDGEEYQITIPQLMVFGERIFTAKWTSQEGQGRPKVKGTATSPPLSDPADPRRARASNPPRPTTGTASLSS